MILYNNKLFNTYILIHIQKMLLHFRICTAKFPTLVFCKIKKKIAYCSS